MAAIALTSCPDLSLSSKVQSKGLDQALHGDLYRMHYSKWMLLGLTCCATGKAACLSDPT